MIPVPSIEYVNVRIRSFHSRLFNRDTYEVLLSGDNLGALTTFLLDHPLYSHDIEAALEELPEREGLERGVTDHFGRCVSHVLHMSHDNIRTLFETALSSFDIKNLKAILLARHRGLPFNKVRDMVIPCGTLTRTKYAEIFHEPDMDSIIQKLSASSPYCANALKQALGETGEHKTFVRFLNSMEAHYYSNMLKYFDNSNENTTVLNDIIRFEIDLKNITSALKNIWENNKIGPKDPATFISGGTLSVSFLNEMSLVSKLDDALEMIESTKFHKAVEKGIIYYAETGFLHEMERFFEEVFVMRTQVYRRFQPFSVGVFISYVWAQFIELTNLRTIINGIAFKTGAGQIRKGIIYV